MERWETVRVCPEKTICSRQKLRMGIASYLKTSLIEWPDKIASIIFTPGCNFRCPFCHNASLVKNSGLSLIAEDKVLADLKKRKTWIDAVVVTGGEPTLQVDLYKFLRKVKKMALSTMIHTNGTGSESVSRLLKERLLDYIAMDLKGDFEDYARYTGNVEPQMSKVKSSMELIVGSGVEYEFRTTVVPGLHDLENLKRLANELKNIIHNTKYKIQPRWYLQQFQPKNNLDKKFLKIKPYSKEEMENFQRHLQKIIPQTLLRGV